MNLRTVIASMAIAVTAVVYSPVYGQGAVTLRGSNATSKQATEKAIAQQQQRLIEIDEGLAPIRTRPALDRYLASHTDSPLAALKPMDRQIFVSSLRFGLGGGVASFSYAALRNLTPTQIYNVLALFGLQRYTYSVGSTNIVTKTDQLLMQPRSPLLLPPLKDYACYQHGTCIQDKGKYCTAQC